MCFRSFIYNLIPAEDMPRVLEVGAGGCLVVETNAYVISNRAFSAYRSHPIEDANEKREVTVGKRLLFHSIVDRNKQPDTSMSSNLQDGRQEWCST